MRKVAPPPPPRILSKWAPACALLLLLAALTAPAAAQPPTPTVTLFLANNGDLMIRVTGDSSVNALEWQHRTAPGGTSSYGDWSAPSAALNTGFSSVGYGNTILIQSNVFDATLCYHAISRVYHSSTANNRSAWGEALFGDCLGPYVIRYDLGQLYTFAAAPVVYFTSGDHLVYYAAGPGGVGVHLGATRGPAALLAQNAPAAQLAAWVNPVSGKPVTVDWDGEGLIKLSTYYADTVHDSDKPVVIAIGAGGQVNILVW